MANPLEHRVDNAVHGSMTTRGTNPEEITCRRIIINQHAKFMGKAKKNAHDIDRGEQAQVKDPIDYIIEPVLAARCLAFGQLRDDEIRDGMQKGCGKHEDGNGHAVDYAIGNQGCFAERLFKPAGTNNC